MFRRVGSLFLLESTKLQLRINLKLLFTVALLFQDKILNFKFFKISGYIMYNTIILYFPKFHRTDRKFNRLATKVFQLHSYPKEKKKTISYSNCIC